MINKQHEKLKKIQTYRYGIDAVDNSSTVNAMRPG
jgi:hypothetical protein